MRRWIPTLLLLPCLWAAGPTAAEEATDELELLVVRAPAERQPEALRLDDELRQGPRLTNLGEAIAELVGVDGVRRGGSMVEPVLRGLGWERVAIQMNHLPLYGACPGRMDPPLRYLRGSVAGRVDVIKGLPSATLGPAGTGGRVVVETDHERGPLAPPGWGGSLRTGYDGARAGTRAEIGLSGGNERLDLRLALEGMRYGDYESAKGILVPAEQEEASAALNFGLRLTEEQRWWNALLYTREETLDYPALPMDLVSTDGLFYTTGHRYRPREGRLLALDSEFGFSLLDHVMDNADKPNRSTMEAVTNSESDGLALRVSSQWDLGSHRRLELGMDHGTSARDAVRERRMVATGMRFLDHMWPDVSHRDTGLFAELAMPLASAWTLRLSGRADRFVAQADAADDPSLQGLSVRESWVEFYGPQADVDECRDWNGSGNLLLRYRPDGPWTLHAGAGLASRSPATTERFFAYAPAPGGFRVGNPTLDPERKTELVAGVGWHDERMALRLSLHHAWISDYVLPTVLELRDVDGDGNDDRIQGFVNDRARLYGVEFSGTIWPGRHWTVPISVGAVRGLRADEAGDLPEIPPLEATAALRYDRVSAFPWWARFGARFVADQDRVDPSFPEDRTAGFAVFHLRGGLEPWHRLRIEIGVENLFDREYQEHLQREAALPVGDLARGQEIPAPGRSVGASLRWRW